MRRLTILVFLVLLAIPQYVHAASSVAVAPDWRVGDRWSYDLTTVSGYGTTPGTLTVTVTGMGPARAGNATVEAYTVSRKQSMWGFGANTTVTATVLVEKKTLCTLFENRSTVTVFGTTNSTVREEVVYSPSDGRYSFPLVPGLDWNATFNVSVTRYNYYNFAVENSTETRRYDCLAFEPVTINDRAFRVRFSVAGGDVVTSWYSAHFQNEVRREEQDASSGATTTYVLKSYARGPEPSFFASPDNQRAIWLAGMTVAVVLAALAVKVYPGARFRWGEYARRSPRMQRMKAAWRRAFPEKADEDHSREKAPDLFRPENTRAKTTLTVNTRTLLCPTCHRTFAVPVTARDIRCPHCGREGRLG